MPLSNLFKWVHARTGFQEGETARPKPDVGPLSAGATGMRVCSVEELLLAHKDVIARIKLCYGCDHATFAADLLEPIRNYANYVNALPATGSSYNSSAGGMLRLGLEVAFYALQATDSQIFAGRQTISNRRVLEPRWRRATFIAGLCSELYRCFNQVLVRDAQGERWQPYVSPLTEWLRQRRSGTFQVQWTVGPERRAPSLFALPMIVRATTMEDLAFSNDVIVPNMLASISGLATYHEHNVMDRLVRHAAALVIQRQRNATAATGVPDDVPAHLARHLVEAMRELVQSDHNWLPNAPRSRLWYAEDGLYLVWPNGASDVIRLLADERLPGAPDTPQAALEILVAGGVVPEKENGKYVVLIQPPGAQEPMDAISLVPPSLLLADVFPQPVPIPEWLAVGTERTGTAPQPQAQEVSLEDAMAVPPMDIENMPQQSRRRQAKPKPVEDAVQASLPLQEMLPAESSLPNKGGKVKRAQEEAHGAEQIPHDNHGKASQQKNPALRPPMRLNRTVARALSAIVSTLYGSKPQCHVLAGALFVPLASLDQHGVDARQAWRSLFDAGMLELSESGEAVQSPVIDGASVPGVFIAAEFLTGVSVGKASPVDAKGERHADA